MGVYLVACVPFSHTIVERTVTPTGRGDGEWMGTQNKGTGAVQYLWWWSYASWLSSPFPTHHSSNHTNLCWNCCHSLLFSPLLPNRNKNELGFEKVYSLQLLLLEISNMFPPPSCKHLTTSYREILFLAMYSPIPSRGVKKKLEENASS